MFQLSLHAATTNLWEIHITRGRSWRCQVELLRRQKQRLPSIIPSVHGLLSRRYSLISMSWFDDTCSIQDTKMIFVGCRPPERSSVGFKRDRKRNHLKKPVKRKKERRWKGGSVTAPTEQPPTYKDWWNPFWNYQRKIHVTKHTHANMPYT